MPKINIRLKKQAIKLHLVRSVHLDARKILPRIGIKCGGFYACFFVQRVARYGSVISYRSVHLDARMIQPRCGIKCGDF